MTQPASTNSDILWKGRNRDGWNQGGRYKYKDESLSIAEIAARSGQCETKVRDYIWKYSWSLEKFFSQFGDTGPNTEPAHTAKNKTNVDNPDETGNNQLKR